MKVKIDKADRMFAIFIKNRDKWICQRCGKGYSIGSQGLHNSHFWGRRRESTRFDEMNCDAICFGCHQYFGANPAEHTKWKKKQLGVEKYNLLMVRARTYCKKDRRLMALILSKKLKEQEDIIREIEGGKMR